MILESMEMINNITLNSASGQALWRSQADIIGQQVSYLPCNIITMMYKSTMLTLQTNNRHTLHAKYELDNNWARLIDEELHRMSN